MSRRTSRSSRPSLIGLLALAALVSVTSLPGAVIAGGPGGLAARRQQVRKAVDLHREAYRVAPLSEALTFARYRVGDSLRLIAVTYANSRSLRGVNMTELAGRESANSDVTSRGLAPDPIRLFSRYGYEELRRFILAAPEHRKVRALTSDLVVPAGLTAHHIAAGTNFPVHAAEADVQGGPFLFAKLVSPTPPTAPVFAGSALLDYEVELAWVTLQNLGEGDRPRFMGLILANDYTDRAALLRGIDPANVDSGTGFASGKSAPGFLPVGPFFVIPRDFREFSNSLHLNLTVNGEPRQSAPVSRAVWGPAEILRETWARKTKRWEHDGRRIGLVPPPAFREIPAGTMLMSGTPGGTVFGGVDFRAKIVGTADWLFSRTDGPLSGHVIERYIATGRCERRFLQNNDEIKASANGLGIIHNRILRPRGSALNTP